MYCSIIFGDLGQYYLPSSGNPQASRNSYNAQTYIYTRDQYSWEVEIDKFKIYKTNKEYKSLNYGLTSKRYVVFEPSSPYLYMPKKDFESFKSAILALYSDKGL